MPSPDGAVAALWRRLARYLRPPRRLRFTREGKFFFGIALGIGFAAINTGNNLLYLLLGWVLSLILASGVMSEQVLRGLAVTRIPPREIFAGQPFLMGIALRNLKKRLSSFSIEIEDLTHDRTLDKKCYFLKIPAGKAQTATYRQILPRRGLYRFHGVRVGTRYPFSLFAKSRIIEKASEVVVFPAISPVILPAASRDHFGEEALARIGRRGEFHGLREFREGDDQHDVHWRSSAHRGRLMVREFEAESHRRVNIIFDNIRAGDSEFERTVSLVGSLAAGYIANSYAVRLIGRGFAVPCASGPEQLHRILKVLALVAPVDATVLFAARAEPGIQTVKIAPGSFANWRPIARAKTEERPVASSPA